MQEDGLDTPELTDDQLRAALRRMGRDARQAAFAAGRAVPVLKDGVIVALHADGTEEIVALLGPGTDTGPDGD